jgi:Spy/CpxP family protein refolding chaperone
MKKFVIALMVTATSALALAQTAGPGLSHRHGHRGGFEKLATKLNLTDAQKQQMKDIRTADRERNKQLNADFRTKVQQFRALKQANDPGAADVKAELESMKAQVQAARQATHEAMLGVLTADQRAQLETAKQSRGFARPEGRGLRGAIAQKLNLTDAQKTQLRQLRETTRQQNQQLFADARARRRELRSLTKADDPRASEIKAQLEALRPQLEAARQQQHAAFVNILTPEQRTQLEQWKTQRQQKLR